MTDRGSPDRTVSEIELLVLVAAVWCAVLRPFDQGSSLLVAGGAGVAAVVVRPAGRARVPLLLFAVVALASHRGAAAEADYVIAGRATLADAPAIMVTDIEPRSFGWRAEAKLQRTGQRVRLEGAGLLVPDLAAGAPVTISGRLGPVEVNDWNRSRHVVGEVAGAEVRSTGAMPWFRRPSEWLRGGVLGSTHSFSADQAALYHGLVIGDDRHQSEGQQAQFRAAGLTHLLAVSGQNVAFLLAVFGPLTRRMSTGLAFGAIVVLLAIFAVATRLEPSVLRATVTAAISSVAALRSARSAGVRSLSLAIVVLLLVDPFLARSVGFRLSVGASLGILLLSASIERRIRGPRWLTAPMAITLAAQVGVSPILMLVFGPVATVTVPANLLAGWAAGAVMTLGLSVGLVAAIVPEPMAALLQMPSRLLVWWIDRVAAEAAGAPLPVVSTETLPWFVASLAVVWWLRPARWWKLWWLVPLVVLALTTSAARPAVDGWYEGPRGAVLVVDDPGRRWVDELVEARITRIEVLVAADGGRGSAQAVARIRDVAEVSSVLAPGDHRIVGARRVLDDTTVPIDGGWIEIVAQPSALDIRVVGAGPDDG